MGGQFGRPGGHLRRRDVAEAGIAALKAVWHRGAVDADGKTGDGAGIHIEIPQDFFADEIRRGGDWLRPGPIGVGQVFLPKTDISAQERCRQIVESEIIAFGYQIYGWRQVPINVGCIGEKANATRPEIEQIMLWSPTPDARSVDGRREAGNPGGGVGYRDAGRRVRSAGARGA